MCLVCVRCLLNLSPTAEQLTSLLDKTPKFSKIEIEPVMFKGLVVWWLVPKFGLDKHMRIGMGNMG